MVVNPVKNLLELPLIINKKTEERSINHTANVNKTYSPAKRLRADRCTGTNFLKPSSIRELTNRHKRDDATMLLDYVLQEWRRAQCWVSVKMHKHAV